MNTEPVSESKAIQNQRLTAALASKGSSSDVIHDYLVQTALRPVDSLGQVLDFGAGVGGLTLKIAATKKAKSITCYDLMSRPQDFSPAIQWRVADLNDDFTHFNEQFDLIVASEIIEHLENPRATARNWFRILKPGGRLILSTPNNESYRALLSLFLRGHFVDFDDSSYPAHITALLPKDLQRVLLEAGFTPPSFDYVPRGVLPKFTRWTWQEVSFGLLNGRRFSDNIVAITSRPKA